MTKRDDIIWEPHLVIAVEPANFLKDDTHHRKVVCLGSTLCISDDPVFAAARILYNRGVDPKTVLVIRTPKRADRRSTIEAEADLGSNNWHYAKPEARPYKPFLNKLQDAFNSRIAP